MSEWAKVSLSEVATIIPGFAFQSKEFSQHGTPVVKIKDINPPLVNSSDLARIDEDAYPLGKLDKYRLHSGDFVVAMTGATIGKVGRYVSKERGLLNQRVAKISPIHSVSWDFIYHAVSMPYFDRFIENNIDSESAQANISASGIGRYPIALPKLKEQEAIAEVLSSLGDKIDLLKRQNKTLEGMAEALFRQWFIEETQDDWEQVPLDDLFEVNPKESITKRLPAPFVEMKNLEEFRSTIGDWRFREFTSGSKFRNGDTLFARITPCLENGKIGLVRSLPTNAVGWGSTEFIVLDPAWESPHCWVLHLEQIPSSENWQYPP